MKALMLTVFLGLVNIIYCAPKQCKPYTLQPGDTCWSLGINQAANPSVKCNCLIAYTQICIVYVSNPTLSAVSCAPGSNTYTIKSGDTCFSLSLSVSVAASQGLNCNNLQIGQVVCNLPATSVTVTQPSVTSCSSGYNLYSIQMGDTCFSLGLSSSDVQNQGLDCKFLQMGQSVCIPNSRPTTTLFPTQAPPTCNSASNQYTIQSGDTCYALGINPSTAANQGINCNNLQIGQIVCRPNIIVTTRPNWNNCNVCQAWSKISKTNV